MRKMLSRRVALGGLVMDEDDFVIPLENIFAWEPTPEERKIVERHLVKNMFPGQPGVSIRPALEKKLRGYPESFQYAHVDDLTQRRRLVGQWLDYQRRNAISEAVEQELIAKGLLGTLQPKPTLNFKPTITPKEDSDANGSE